jgi:FHA domain-containing protein
MKPPSGVGVRPPPGESSAAGKPANNDPGLTKSDPGAYETTVRRAWSDGATPNNVAVEADVPTYLDLRVSPVHQPTPHTIVGVRLEGTDTLTLGRGTFLVGRHAEADLHFDSRDVGRRHARLHVRADGVVVEDLGAANGTFVNGEAVSGECPLADGSRVKFATVEFLVTLLTNDAQLRG